MIFLSKKVIFQEDMLDSLILYYLMSFKRLLETQFQRFDWLLIFGMILTKISFLFSCISNNFLKHKVIT